MKQMIETINQWIDATLEANRDKQQCCLSLPKRVHQFYDEEFLASAFFVETTTIPKPTFIINIPGAEEYLAMDVRGVTYKNTYFVHPDIPLSTHVHELVHVAQWKLLGAETFISEYIRGVQTYGYRDSPLEDIAFTVQQDFEDENASTNKPYDVVERVNLFLLKNKLGLE
ncbi:hypothetical protein NBRC116591_18080 [Sessilibacter corallicola]|uniref:DUF4157 domain-containing protein n=2 Tax=Sessilibacter corallicola TaxID=2904075 RepID=A0ABQ0A8N1_9GAMM